jgi:activator of 2-hydroxyglutaryl-CoA dehydratase
VTTAGLDVGSRTIGLVLLDHGVVDSVVTDTGVKPLERCQRLLSGRSYHQLVVTGYGRHLVAPSLGGEISAHAAGAHYLYPDAGGGVKHEGLLKYPVGL